MGRTEMVRVRYVFPPFSENIPWVVIFIILFRLNLKNFFLLETIFVLTKTMSRARIGAKYLESQH